MRHKWEGVRREMALLCDASKNHTGNIFRERDRDRMAETAHWRWLGEARPKPNRARPARGFAKLQERHAILEAFFPINIALAALL